MTRNATATRRAFLPVYALAGMPSSTFGTDEQKRSHWETWRT